MIAAFFGSVGIAFGAVPILITQDHFRTLGLDIIPIIGRAWCAFILMCFSFAFILWKIVNLFMILKQTTAEEEERQQPTSSISEHVEALYVRVKRFVSFVIWDCPSLLQVFVFGIGSMLTSALDIYNHLKDISQRVMHVYLVQDCIRLPSHLLQMIFYTWYVYDNHVKGAPKSLPRWHHVSIAVMIGTQVWLWVSDTTEPLWTLDGKRNVTLASNSSPQTGSFMFTVEHFLEPFHVEFSTISIGLLYSLWCMTTEKEISRALVKSENRSEKLSARKTQKRDASRSSKCCWAFHIGVATLLALIYIIIVSVILFVPCHRCGKSQYYVFRRLFLFLGFFYVYFGIGLSISSIYALWKLSKTSIKSSMASLGQYLLVITAIVVFVLYMLRIFAAGYDLHNDILYRQQSLDSSYSFADILLTFRSLNNYNIRNITFAETISMDALMIGYPFIGILQVWLQTQLLMDAECRKNIPDVVKKIFIYVIAINFGEWLQTGISLGFDRDGQSSQYTPIMNEFYTDESSRIMRLCLYPFMVLYRFHSAVVAWEIIVEDAEEHHHSVNEESVDGESGSTFPKTEGSPSTTGYDAESSSNFTESIRSVTNPSLQNSNSTVAGSKNGVIRAEFHKRNSSRV